MLAPTLRRTQALWRLGMIKARQHGLFAPGFADAGTRAEIEADIHQAGRISNAYFVLLVCSCGIAALGLLQSSAAVVIGAMLISPLMGPILSLGMALARLEFREFQRAAITLALGAVVSTAAAALIVWASPLKDVTPEILARTRPTLLDLVIAVLSGLVAAYVTITRRGAVIAGVAIATALMPPLAVTGFGIATATPSIVGGSLLLFLTNVVAILGAVFAVARRYGFHPVVRKGAAWEVPVLLLATAALATPLALSLRDIVIEARETHRVRATIEAVFAKPAPRITDLRVRIDHGHVRDVRAVVVTRRFLPQASDSVRGKLGGTVDVEVEQILTADDVPTALTARGALTNRALQTPTPAERTPEQRITEMLAGVADISAMGRQDDRLLVAVRLAPEATLADYMALERATQRFFPALRLEMAPPYRPLAPVVFGRGRSTLDADAGRQVAAIAWALARWNAGAVTVEGAATPGPRGPRARDRGLALRRAEAVAERLRALGVAEARATALVPDEAGDDPARYWTATVRPLVTLTAAPPP